MAADGGLHGNSAGLAARAFWLMRDDMLADCKPADFDCVGSRAALGEQLRGAEVYLPLADALDLRIAECLLEAGARVHAVLADEPEALRRRHALQPDALHAPRFAALLTRCESLSVVGGLLESESQWQRACTQAYAAGRARLAGGAGCLAVQSRDGRCVLVAADSAERPSPLPQPGRRMAGIVFADVAGFRHVGDDTMLRFWNGLFAAIGEAVAALGEAVLCGKTWGDGLHFVTADAATAAAVACTIRSVAECWTQQQDGFAPVSLRIAVHYAPVFVERDPLSGTAAYIGSQLTYAARIEPVTPPGRIYASEACAAQLALEAPQAYRLDSEGRVPLAKDHGLAPLYQLERGSEADSALRAA